MNIGASFAKPKSEIQQPEIDWMSFKVEGPRIAFLMDSNKYQPKFILFVLLLTNFIN